MSECAWSFVSALLFCCTWTFIVLIVCVLLNVGDFSLQKYFCRVNLQVCYSLAHRYFWENIMKNNMFEIMVDSLAVAVLVNFIFILSMYEQVLLIKSHFLFFIITNLFFALVTGVLRKIYLRRTSLYVDK